MRCVTLTKRFLIVAALVLSPLNGVWSFCPPAVWFSARVEGSAADDCQTVCPVPQRKHPCFALSDDLSVVPMVNLAPGPACSTATSLSPLSVGETIEELSSPLHDLLLSPPSPPPRA
jgi:hypothetical protein